MESCLYLHVHRDYQSTFRAYDVIYGTGFLFEKCNKVTHPWELGGRQIMGINRLNNIDTFFLKEKKTFNGFVYLAKPN